MTLQEGIEKLKVLLGKQEPQNEEPIITTEEKFTDAKLQDGTTIVRYDGEYVEPGMQVMLVDPSGVLPLPKGDYVLENGTTFSIVDDNGTADNVVEAPETVATEPKEDANPEMPMTPPAPAPVKNETVTPAANKVKRVIKSQVEEHVFNAFKEEMTKAIAEMNEKFSALEKENKELKENFAKANELNKEVFSVVKQISEEPAATPTEKVKQVFSVTEHRKSFKEDLRRLEQEFNKQ